MRRLEAMVMSKEEVVDSLAGPSILIPIRRTHPEPSSWRSWPSSRPGKQARRFSAAEAKGRRHPSPFPVDGLVSLICRPYCIEAASRPARPPSAYPLEPRNQLFSWRLLLVNCRCWTAKAGRVVETVDFLPCQPPWSQPANLRVK